MFRVKICAMLTLIVLLVMATVYFLLPARLENEIRQNAAQELEVATLSMERYERLNDFSLMAKAEQIAGFHGLHSSLIHEYPDPYAYERHLGVYNKGLLRWQYVFNNLKQKNADVRAVESPLQDRPPHSPELVFVTDDQGSGVAALGTNKYEWYKEPVAKSHPILLSVADGTSRKDVWFWKWNAQDSGALYQVGFAPVMQGPQKLIGTVVVGELISDQVAMTASKALGGHGVAYYYDNKLVASTLSRDTGLSAAIFGGTSSSTSGNPFSVIVDGAEYLVSRQPFVNASSTEGASSGFLVFVDVSERLSFAHQIQTWILIVGLIILLALIVAVLIIIHSFVKPFEEIDQGIQEVIAGNKDYVFEISEKHPFQAEMAQSLNLMSAYLQGKQMPDEEETEGWGDFLIAEVTPTAMNRAVTREDLEKARKTPATAEPVGVYQKRLFDEYVTAKRNLGQSIEDLTLETFVAKLEKHTQTLKARHKARDVRFSVVLLNHKVVLKPQPIF